jgi:hypothetical protein
MIESFKLSFPKAFNKNIIRYLLTKNHWRNAFDKIPENKLYDYLFNSDKQHDFGFSFCSFHEGSSNDDFLNYNASLIYEAVKEQTKFKFIKPKRFFWNYYNRSSISDTHKDTYEVVKHYSFVYNLHTSDGGTYFPDKDQFFKGEESLVLVFDSSLDHQGIGPKNTVCRLNLNCVIESEDYEIND